MRVLVLTQHFAPEVTAARFRIEAFVNALTEQGHDTEVLCPVPNHPGGVVHDAYRRRLRVRRQVNGADVTHLWVAVSPRKTFASRLAYYSSYAAAACMAGVVGHRPDVLIASSPPLPVAAAGAFVARRFRIPWVLDVRDVWPDSPVALGELNNPRLISLAERLERGVYERASAIVTVNEAFHRQIAGRAPAGRRIEVIPNGTTDQWLDAGKAASRREALDLEPEPFVWAYAGNIGLAHGLDVAVEAADLLGDGFTLLIIGDGPQREIVERRAAEARNGAVSMRPLMPAADAARTLRAADALLVSERQEHTVASKLYDYCALGRPVIAACRGELWRVVDEAGIGLTVRHGDAEELADAVRTLREDPALGERLAHRGREFALEHRREEQALRLVSLVEEVRDESKRGPH